MKPIALLAQATAPYRRLLWAGSVLLTLEGLASLAVPWLAGRFTGALLVSGQSDAAIRWGAPQVLAALLVMFALQAALKYGSLRLLADAEERIAADLRIRVYDHLQALPMAFFTGRRHGDTLSLLLDDVYTVSAYVCGSLASLLPMVLTVGGSAYLMAQLHPGLAVLAVLLVPLFFLMLRWQGRDLRSLAERARKADLAAIAIAQENLGMLPAIKTFTREQAESRRYRAEVERNLSLASQQRRIEAALGPGVQFAAAAAIVALLWVAGGAAQEGRMAPENLVTLLLYAQLLTRPVPALASLYGETQNLRTALRRLTEVLAADAERGGTGVLGEVKGQLSMRGLRFAYPDGTVVLRDLDLEVRAGEVVAIVGENGAGKSTLAQLLVRLLEPGHGVIRIDGVDVSTLELASLRRQVGVVPQFPLLFDGSVHDNLAFGRQGASRVEVEAAARLALAHEFVERLPQGYETVIGERGIRLSGGQQQRLALARALVKDPPILVFDEATSMFDPKGELDFLEQARPAMKGRTVLLITHRPASLDFADRVLRLQDGVLQPVLPRE